MNNNKSLTGHLLALLSAFVWGITFVSTKVLLTELSAVEILFYRFLLGYTALWIVHPKKNEFKGFKNELLYAAAGISGTTIYQFLENTALSFTYASNVSIIVSTVPLFAGLIAVFIFKEKMDKKFFIGFFVAILGIVMINLNGSIVLKLKPTGDIMAIGSAMLWAVYTNFVNAINKRNQDVLCTTRHMFFYGVVFILPIMLFGDFEINSIKALAHPKILINILFLGVIASAVCFATWNEAVKHLGPVKSSVYIYLIPVITLIFSTAILHEKIGIAGIAGMALVLAGLVISGYKSKKSDAMKSTPEGISKQ